MMNSVYGKVKISQTPTKSRYEKSPGYSAHSRSLFVLPRRIMTFKAPIIGRLNTTSDFKRRWAVASASIPQAMITPIVLINMAATQATAALRNWKNTVRNSAIMDRTNPKNSEGNIRKYKCSQIFGSCTNSEGGIPIPARTDKINATTLDSPI